MAGQQSSVTLVWREGQTCLPGCVVTPIAARFAKAVGDTAICSLYDIMKAYDHLDWGSTIDAAIELGFPLMLLRFIFSLYAVKRYVVIEKGIVRTSVPVRSTVARSPTS